MVLRRHFLSLIELTVVLALLALATLFFLPAAFTGEFQISSRAQGLLEDFLKQSQSAAAARGGGVEVLFIPVDPQKGRWRLERRVPPSLAPLSYFVQEKSQGVLPHTLASPFLPKQEIGKRAERSWQSDAIELEGIGDFELKKATGQAIGPVLLRLEPLDPRLSPSGATYRMRVPFALAPLPIPLTAISLQAAKP